MNGNHMKLLPYYKKKEARDWAHLKD